MTADFAPLGLAIGHATDSEGATGLTVVRGVHGHLRAASAVIGRATGTRELDTTMPWHLADRADVIMLAGGSAYGLDAAAGAMRWCEERGRGFPIGAGVVPIVPAAIIYDLTPLGRFDARPTADMAYAACEGARSSPVAEGSVGAGTGATVGGLSGTPMKGGVGCATLHRDGLTVGAIAVVNALGDVRDAHGRIIAGGRRETLAPRSSRRAAGAAPKPMANTTLALVAIDRTIGRPELAQLAQAAGGALHRRIVPAGTSFDGDVVFAVCPPPAGSPGAGPPPRDHDRAERAPESHHSAALPSESSRSLEQLLAFEMLAVLALEEAIERAVRLARGRDGIPGLADTTAA